MSGDEAPPNPLLAALPPATDYITYLTIVEYNLTAERLPTLHQVLQDPTLTTNIGWDLVHLLLPLLPASEECLQDVALKGNPREVILKVTEALRLMQYANPEAEEEESENDEGEEVAVEEALRKTKLEGGGEVKPLPLPVLQFETLLSMLATLHRRVKTKYPSRFLSTSLQAVLVSYSSAESHMDELTAAVVKFIKTLSGTKRPHLPPRVSSGNILQRTTSQQTEPDPEAQSEGPSLDETKLSERLLQSLVTHVTEDYMGSLSSADDVPGLAWSSRLMEKLEPGKIVPGKPTFAERFSKDEGLKGRSSVVGQLVAVGQDLGLDSRDLFQTFTDESTEEVGSPGEESDPPASANDIPLSRIGSLYLFTARSVARVLYGQPPPNDGIAIFPEHAKILRNFVGTAGTANVGLESEALLDAILCLGLLALDANAIDEPYDDEEFAQYLQTVTLISANSPSPTIRYHAHYLASTILRSHPEDLVRLAFIRDTLEHCPYENLKASAVGWLKGETLEANMPPATAHSHTHAHPHQETEESKDPETSIFATPIALTSLAPFLFPDLSTTILPPVPISEAWATFRNELGFYLATLNFYYLLLSATFLHEALDIAGLTETADVGGSFLGPLRQAVSVFKDSLKEGGELAAEEESKNSGGLGKQDGGRGSGVRGSWR
ncbi:DUF1760-domain-containing protein [Mytilinidion resinicola]|uniref:DUF1760-domain-containing protein n=1 Tax=Mytilinidion resinicola TaxID=574789 RepID=A0A6A6ZAI2_9PEZI|nr:DUF1760-domain-containing protein [Mytilinidion resinicola]KAF2817743.1 DUF1760-domain-containing protein [Mytilinidion resinicola]